VVVSVGLTVSDRSSKPPRFVYESEQVRERLWIHKQCADGLSRPTQLSLHASSLGCECLAYDEVMADRFCTGVLAVGHAQSLVVRARLPASAPGSVSFLNISGGIDGLILRGL